MTAVGQLQIASVAIVAPSELSADDARRAGHASLDALHAHLAKHDDGELYRIELGPLRADPRIALRQTNASDDERRKMRARLSRFDTRSTAGPWTRRTLELIRSHPGLRAADLCRRAGQEKMAFKANVRKLKGMGLTESLEVGYRLSPRGSAFLQDLERHERPPD